MFLMRRFLGVSFALAMTLSGPALAGPMDPTTSPPGRTGQAADPDSYGALTDRLQPALTEERWADALAILKAMATHADFPLVNADARLATFYLTGILSLELDRPEAAVAPLVAATNMSGATPNHWFRRIEAENRSGDRTGATNSLAQMLQRFPAALNDVSPRYMLQQATDPDLDKAVGFELRATLFAADWHDEAESLVWMIHIDELLARDETDRARTVARRVTSPSAVIQLHAMRRYDPLTADSPPIDIEAMMATALAELRLKVAAANADLAAYSGLSAALFNRGELAEALATTDTALAGPDPEAGTDAARDRVWIMDTRARTLMALGRYDEAVAQMQTASTRNREGGVNVSQTINLSWLYLRVNRNAEALALMAGFDRSTASPFGVMQAVQIQACAASALGDGAAAETAYVYLASHWHDAPRAAIEALLCREDIDGAAAIMVRRLDDPDLAAQALSDLHHYLPPPAPTPFDARLSAGDAAMAVRPEVIAARDRVGRVFSVPTLGGQF
jgi:tetratricopeptide (TPR) repeat protein